MMENKDIHDEETHTVTKEALQQFMHAVFSKVQRHHVFPKLTFLGNIHETPREKLIREFNKKRKLMEKGK